jgi:hypothetical protein
VNSASYCEILLKLRDAILRIRPGQLARGVLLHHDTARPHLAGATQERIPELQWELLALPSLWSVNNHLGGKRFADEGVEKGVRKWLRQRSKDFHTAGFDALVKRWDKCINVGGGYVEK